MKLKKYSTLKTQIRDRILIVTLNRPEVRNALNQTMVNELTDVFSDPVDDTGVTNIIITGAGSSFCAGADLSYLKSLQGLTLADQKLDSENLLAMYKNIYYYSKPVTALVNGPAIGGGCGLAGICDFILASDSAKFGYPEVKIGFTPAIVSVFLLYSLGYRKAKELLLSGRILDANEALDYGLINKIESSETLFTSGIAFVQELAKNSPL
jgi:methylglutaconyl-CoA hydratase